jgi:hypothetical protein
VLQHSAPAVLQHVVLCRNKLLSAARAAAVGDRQRSEAHGTADRPGRSVRPRGRGTGRPVHEHDMTRGIRHGARHATRNTTRCTQRATRHVARNAQQDTWRTTRNTTRGTQRAARNVARNAADGPVSAKPKAAAALRRRRLVLRTAAAWPATSCAASRGNFAGRDPRSDQAPARAVGRAEEAGPSPTLPLTMRSCLRARM